MIITILLALNLSQSPRTEMSSKPPVNPPIVETATITGYSSIDSCSNAKCEMSSGKSAYVGAVACPRKLKLGTKVVIRGTTYICEDRTAMKYNGRYDLFIGYGKEAHKKAMKFGKQKLEVTILKSK